MHDIEPYFNWRDEYTAENDENSPFYGRSYSEFEFTHKIYNYYIHPQWDAFGSTTLYAKLLYVDYDANYAHIELIGEWNDTLYNDIMFLKRYVIDPMIEQGIVKFVLLCDNVLNFHASDDAYYEEWYDDVKEADGWIAMVNTFDHVLQETRRIRLQYYVHFGPLFNDLHWQGKRPEDAFFEVERLVNGSNKRSLLS